MIKRYQHSFYPTIKSTVKHGWFAILLIGMIILAACSTPTPVETPTAVPSTSTPIPPTAAPEVPVEQLFDTMWVLVGYGDPANPTVIPQGTQITAEFTADLQLSGNAGCNNYFGPYEASKDGTLTIGIMGSTMMFCDQGMELEAAYLAALQKATNFNFSNEGRLLIKYSDESNQEQQLVYIKGQINLTDATWLLVSSGDPNSPQPVTPGVIITADFSTEGLVSGTAGCNRYFGEYTIEGDKITITQPGSTMMACPTGMEEETAFLTALGKAQQYSITLRTLSITYDDGAGVLNFSSAKLPFEYTLWTLGSIGSEPLPEGVEITAAFVPEESTSQGTVSGSAGCNQYVAGYTLETDSITIETPAITMMMCEDKVMEAESAYLAAIQSATSYQILGNNLILSTENGTLNFLANRTPLEGALWSLIAFGDVKDPQNPVTGSNFSAQFMRNAAAPSGVMVGTTGCNEYAAAYAASLEEIKINPPASTENTSCVPGLVDQEQTYFLALNNATTYRIEGNTLTIPYDEDRQALVFEGTQLNVASRAPLTDLNNTQWFLWYINNQPTLPGTSINGNFTINPDGASGIVNGNAGCNTYQAIFGENLGMQSSLTSRQSCNSPAGVMDQETTYLQSLSRSFGYWLTGNQLIINTGQGTLTYRSTRPPQSSDQTHLLVSKNWFLISYNNTYSVPGTQEPFILFNPNGTLTGFTGCNNLNGDYRTNINQITISSLSNTQSACTDAALQAQEQAIMNLLGAARTYQVADTAMQIIGDNGVLNYSLSPLNRPEEIQPPVAVIDGPSQAKVGEAVTFDGTESYSPVQITSYRWDFGDGGSGTGVVVQYVYNKPGTYRVKLTVTDQRNESSSSTLDIVISALEQPTPEPTQPPQETATPAPTGEPTPTSEPPVEVTPPQAAIQGPSQVFLGEPASFDASTSTPGSNPIASYTWNFGDGTTAGPDANPTQTTLFNRTGAYQVSVVVSDAEGLSSSATLQVAVTTRLDTPVAWTLDNLQNRPLLPGTAITLQFLQGSIAGFAGCNTYNANYEVTPNDDGSYSVTVTNLTTSKLACPQNIMDQEAYYLTFLETVTRAQLELNILTLSYPAGVGPNNNPYPEGVLKFYEIGTR